MRLLTTLFLVLAMTIAGCSKKDDSVVYKIGYMNCNNDQETSARFRPLTKYLSDKIGVKFETVNVDTYDFEDRMKAEKFAFTHTNSILYISLKEHLKLQLLATEKRGQFGTHTAGTIIARKGSGIKTFADLRGKRLVFGPMLAPTGYMAEYDLMLRNGINPEKDLSYYAIPQGSFKHEKVIYGVLYGAFDAGAAPILDLEVMTREGKITADDFVIIGQSPLIPYCTFGAAAETDPKLVAKVQEALLALTPETTVEIDGEKIRVLGAAWVDGFSELTDKDYDGIRDMARRVGISPYQEFK